MALEKINSLYDKSKDDEALRIDVKKFRTAINALQDELASEIASLTTQIESVSSVPSGAIFIWSGAIADIPTGYALCNGSNGTPDLRDKFVIGAKEDDSGTPKTNVTGSLTQSGGEAEHTLTIDEMPAHTHSVAVDVTGGFLGGFDSGTGQPGSVTSGSTGSGDAHNNLPPYYSLAYIMKT